MNDTRKKDDRIVLVAPRPLKKAKDDGRLVRISADANAVLMRLYRITGLPLSTIVSEMVIQGAELVDIVEDGEDEA